MFVYLTRSTWTNGDESSVLATEVLRAMELQLPLLLAHEMPGDGEQQERHACEFSHFFTVTPPEVLRGGIYSKIAAPLKGGEWRKVSMLMMMETAFALEDKKTQKLKRSMSTRLSERHVRSDKANDTESGKAQDEEASSIRIAAVRARLQMPSKGSGLSRMLESLRRLLPPIRQASPIVEEHFDDEHFDEVPRTRLIGFSGDAKHRSPKSVDRASNERSEQGQQVTERV